MIAIEFITVGFVIVLLGYCKVFSDDSVECPPTRHFEEENENFMCATPPNV
jgi:hypothetical protein